MIDVDTNRYRAATGHRSVRKNVSIPAWIEPRAEQTGWYTIEKNKKCEQENIVKKSSPSYAKLHIYAILYIKQSRNDQETIGVIYAKRL